jgi:outer membrane protein assembly factor BamE
MNSVTVTADRRTRGLALVLALGLVGLVGLGVSGCIYRINIHQGNFLEAKTLDQLAPGMTRSQVRFLLGTPMVADEFSPNRWDYFYYFKDGKTRHEERRHFLVLEVDAERTAGRRVPHAATAGNAGRLGAAAAAPLAGRSSGPARRPRQPSRHRGPGTGGSGLPGASGPPGWRRIRKPAPGAAHRATPESR